MLPPLRALVLALALGALCAFAVACGQEEQGSLINSSRAEAIKTQLDKIDDDVRGERCEQALTDHLAALKREIDDLPGTVDRDLRARLREGQEHLDDIAPTECGADTQTTTTTTTTETIPEETTPTVPPATTTEQTPPPETQTTPTAPPETTPTQPTPTEPTPTVPAPGESGGEEAPGAVIE